MIQLAGIQLGGESGIGPKEKGLHPLGMQPGVI
jgi:hypothetical protein